MAGRASRFLGDSPWRVAIKLIVLSFIVGVVMRYTGFTPIDLFIWLSDGIAYFWNQGFDALQRFFGYFVLGAIIVVPVFLLIRLLNYRRY